MSHFWGSSGSPAQRRIATETSCSRGSFFMSSIICPENLSRSTCDRTTAPEIRRFCAARLADHKVPRTIVWLERIPLTERGKTDRATLETFVREHLHRTAESGVL